MKNCNEQSIEEIKDHLKKLRASNTFKTIALISFIVGVLASVLVFVLLKLKAMKKDDELFPEDYEDDDDMFEDYYAFDYDDDDLDSIFDDDDDTAKAEDIENIENTKATEEAVKADEK